MWQCHVNMLLQADTHPFVYNNSNQADYNTTVNSWLEQRTYVTQAPRLLVDAYPEFASNLSAALASYENVTEPTVKQLIQSNYHLQNISSIQAGKIFTTASFECGRFHVAINNDGSLGSLLDTVSNVDLVGDVLKCDEERNSDDGCHTHA